MSARSPKQRRENQESLKRDIRLFIAENLGGNLASGGSVRFSQTQVLTTSSFLP